MMLESDIINNTNITTGAADVRLLAMSFMTYKIGKSNRYFYRPQTTLDQNNVFTNVCNSVRMGWLPNMHHRSHDQGGLDPGGPVLGGDGLHPRELGRPPHGMLRDTVN